MNNTEILALPDVVAALQSWWDETPGAFTRGVTSAVIADLLDDYGYEWPPPNVRSPTCGEWLRLGPGASTCIFDPSGGPFHEAAGIFRVSVGTAANPRIMHMVNWFGSQLRARGMGTQDMADAQTLVSPEDAGRIVRSREYRVEVAHYPNYIPNWEKPLPIQVAGFLHPILYGMHFVLNDVQPGGQIDCWCGEHVITARVY